MPIPDMTLEFAARGMTRPPLSWDELFNYLQGEAIIEMEHQAIAILQPAFNKAA